VVVDVDGICQVRDEDGDKGKKHRAPHEFHRTDKAEEDPGKTPEVGLFKAIAHPLIIS
jgi:hypothetical protein